MTTAGYRVRFTGALRGLSDADRRALLDRARADEDPIVSDRVRSILGRVRVGGDEALQSLTKELDGVDLASIEAPREAIDGALSKLDGRIRAALERAATNIEKAHRAFLPQTREIETEPGVWVGRRADPLAAVGVYAPGGRAPYPSSVLMGVVPARVAGVAQVVVCSPPSRSGLPSDIVLAAAAIAGATRVFSVGGAQAIAALAFGTSTIPRVERIVGPGNAYVAEAKRQVCGFVGIDAPAGPSEILVLADESAKADHIARELVTQAEHDPEASCVALVTSTVLAAEVVARLSEWPTSTRSEIVLAALSSRGAVLSVSTFDEALAFAEAYAAEHLLLAVRDPEALLPSVRHAGTIFYGDGASVSFGDYMTGANHVLPTAGAARSFSGLSTLDFVRFTTYQRIDRSGAASMSEDTALLADAEGLVSHADAARAAPGGASAEPRAVEPVKPRPSYAKMKLYTSNRKPAAIDLSDNTNQLGAPPGARRLLDAGQADALSHYPSHYGEGLKRALAERLGIPVEAIVTGCGSDDVLDSTFRAFASPGEPVAFPTPTFAMLPFFCHMNDLEPHPVPLLSADRGYDIDVEAMLATGAAIQYVCSPNNPTGTLASVRSVERLIEGARGLVVLDEAYIEYGGESFTRRAPTSPRVVVVRTLSKAYGLAGARIGYAISHPTIAAEIEKSRGPYKITHLAERMAEAVIREDEAWVAAGIGDVKVSRERFEAWLSARNAPFIPSAANFVLVKTEGALGAAARMREQGIAVRPFPNLPGFGDALRISVGPWSVMERILSALEEVLG